MDTFLARMTMTMIKRMKIVGALAVITLFTLLASTGFASAQCQRIIQNGTIQNNAPVVWVAPCVIGQAGPSTGSAGNPPMLNDLGVQGNLGIVDGLITGQYHSALLGWNRNIPGEFDINLSGLGGAGAVSAYVIENGVKLPFPGSGGGNVSVAGTPTSCNVVEWNGSTNVRDSGAPALLTATTVAQLEALPVTLLTCGTKVRLTGYYIAGGGPGPSVEYALSTAACSLGSGFGDGGSQLPSTTPGNCWILMPQTAYDVRTWGATGSGLTTTGTCSGTSVTLSSAQDFENGETIDLYGCGASAAPVPPSGLAIGSLPVTGSQTDCYELEPYNTSFAVGPATSQVCVTNAPTALGFPNDTGNVNQYVPLSWTLGSGDTGVIVLAKYGTGGTMAPIAVTTGTSLNDYGQPQTLPNWVPTSPTTVVTPGQCEQKIASGGGTTALVLAGTCPSNGTAVVTHDDSVSVANALLAQPTVHFPCGTYEISEVLAISGTGQTLATDAQPGCVVLQFASASGDAIDVTGTADRIDPMTLDGSNMAAGQILNLSGAVKFQQNGEIQLLNVFNGVVIQNGSSGDLHFGRVLMQGSARGPGQQFYMVGTNAAATALLYIDYFQGVKSYYSPCAEFTGHIQSIFADRFTCQASVPVVGTPNSQFSVDNANNSNNGPILLQFRDLALNNCVTRCGFLSDVTQFTAYRIFSQAQTGNGTDNWHIDSLNSNTKLMMGDIFGGDQQCIYQAGFLTQLVDVNSYSCSHGVGGANVGMYAGVEVRSTAVGTNIVGGSNYAIAAGDVMTPNGYGVLIDAGSMNTSVTGATWIGRIGGVVDNASPAPIANVRLDGLPYGSPPTSVINASGGQTWTASANPALYSCSGIAVLARSGTAGNNFTDTTDTAANIIAAMPASCRIVNKQFRIRVESVDGGIMTVSGGTGVTMAGTTTIPAGSGFGLTSYADFVGTLTATGSLTGTTAPTAVTLYGCSQTAGQNC